MLLNIETGRGVPTQRKEDILVLVCSLLGIGTYTDEVQATVEPQVAAHQLPLKVVTRPNWFFR